LLTLLVEPLYGNEPSAGVRELMQNAVDAVCELEAWCSAHGKSVDSLDLPEQDGDVLIEFIERENGTWFLRVRDRGIGMRSETIQNYFLRAGASFRRSPEWAKEFLDDMGQPRVVRAGRFGIGAFAVFLLGPSFRLWTRHVSADKSMGYRIEASANSQLIEICRVGDLPIGTTIEVELNSEALKTLSHRMRWRIDWFCWNWPTVKKRVVSGQGPKILKQRFALPLRKRKLPPEWSVIYPEGFDAVYWTFSHSPSLSCNGLKVARPERGMESSRGTKFDWPDETQLNCPSIAVLDSAANLPLTIQRYRLSQRTVPFIDELVRDVTMSYIAHSLVCGPTSCSEALSFQHGHPLRRRQFSKGNSSYLFSKGLLRWCITSTGMIPVDPWFYSLLNVESCLLYGARVYRNFQSLQWQNAIGALMTQMVATEYVTLPWFDVVDLYERTGSTIDLLVASLDYLARKGVPVLGHEVKSSQVLVSVDPEFDLKSLTRSPQYWFYKDEKPGLVTSSEIHSPDSPRVWLEQKKGTFIPRVSLKSTLEIIEATLSNYEFPLLGDARASTPNALYVAEIKTKRAERSPESSIAKIWNECLGPRAIPFDPNAREAMIAEVCKHPELKRHIEAWQEMKRTGSKWVNLQSSE